MIASPDTFLEPHTGRLPVDLSAENRQRFLTAPANTCINYSGNDWNCTSGFHKQGESCDED
jgi:hypothetical protein